MQYSRVLSLLLVASALPQMAQMGCEPDPAPTCDNMIVQIDVAGDIPVVGVTNFNGTTAKYQMNIEGSHCSTSSCPVGLAINDVEIAAGATQYWEVEPGVDCADVICCEEGWVGEIHAELLLFGEGCFVNSTAQREECSP